VPRLSEIQAWPTAHLEAANTSWTTTARTWDDSFSAVYEQTRYPGGTLWDGQTADAAAQQIGADRLKVLGAADNLHTTAAVARTGVGQLQTARQLAVAAVAEAQAAGFTVGEDLSVTDSVAGRPPAVQAARMAQAQRLAATIHSRAAALVAADNDIAARITSATAGLKAVQFDENPIQLANGRIPAPEGPIVWCLLQGTAGHSWRCSVLYPDGGTDWYWSTQDDSGGSL
jgi:hypothetical protein